MSRADTSVADTSEASMSGAGMSGAGTFGEREARGGVGRQIAGKVTAKRGTVEGQKVGERTAKRRLQWVWGPLLTEVCSYRA